MNKDIRNHIKHVTSSSYLKKRFDKCDVYFEESTHIEFDRLGFEDSTWHHDGSPSFRVTSEDGYRVIQCFMGEDDWNYTHFKRFQLCIDDEHIFDCMELIEMYGFIKSNLDLFKSLANGDEQKREIDEHNCEIINTIMVLQKIWSNIQSDIFYDARWDNHEYDANAFDQRDMEVALEKAIDIINKERK